MTREFHFPVKLEADQILDFFHPYHPTQSGVENQKSLKGD